MSVTARLKKLLNVVTREALFCSFFNLGIMALSLSFFLYIKHKNMKKYVRMDSSMNSFT
jgi:hypothetical protein